MPVVNYAFTRLSTVVEQFLTLDRIYRRIMEDPKPCSFRLARYGDTGILLFVRCLSNYWPLTLICRPAGQRWLERCRVTARGETGRSFNQEMEMSTTVLHG